MCSKILVRGENTGVTTFLKWYRLLDVKQPIRLLTRSRWIGVREAALPSLAVGIETPLSVGAVPVDAAKVLYMLVEDEGDHCSESLVSFPTVKCELFGENILNSLTLASALTVKERLLEFSGDMLVYGGFEGLIAADELYRAGFNPILVYEDKPFRDVFDPDMATLALSIVREDKLKLLPSIGNTDKPLFIYGCGKHISYHYEEDSVVLDYLRKVWGDIRLPLSDYTWEKIGFALAHFLQGISVPSPQPSRVAYFKNHIFASIGYKAEELEGEDYAATRISIKRMGRRLGVIKLIADRQKPAIIGVQAILPRSEIRMLEVLYLAASIGLSPLQLIFAAENTSIITMLAEALWRKVSRKFYEEFLKKSNTCV